MRNSGTHDNTTEDLFLFFLIFAVVWAGMYFYPEPASWLWHWITYAETKVLSLIDVIFSERTQNNIENIQQGVTKTTPGTIGWSVMLKVESALYPWNNLLYAIPIAGVAAWVWFSAQKHHRRHSMESLIELQTRTWRFSRMWVKFDPTKECPDVTKGRFRISDDTIRIAKEGGLLSKQMGGDYDLDVDGLKNHMAFQLGQRFVSLHTLKEHEEWVAAAAILRIAKKKKESDELLGDISYYFADEWDIKDIRKKVRKILKTHENHPIVVQNTRRHAYVTTFLMGLVMAAKKSGCGKFTTARMPWLQLKDRPLFFALNKLGTTGLHNERQTPLRAHPEGFAPTVHYIYECKLKQGLPEPTSSQAAEMFHTQLKEDLSKGSTALSA